MNEKTPGKNSQPLRASKDLDERERQEREYKMNYKRYHNPLAPIQRTLPEKLSLLVLQIFLSTAAYYYFSYYNDAPTRFLNSYYQFYSYNIPVDVSALSFLFGIFFLILLSKLFTKGTTILGSFLGEMLIQHYYFRNSFEAPQMYLFILILFGPFVFLPYKGGEFLEGKNILKEFYILIVTGLVGTVFIFTFLQYQYSVQLGLTFFISYILSVTIPLCILFAILDKKLLPYFPLTEEEMNRYAELEKQEANTENTHQIEKALLNSDPSSNIRYQPEPNNASAVHPTDASAVHPTNASAVHPTDASAVHPTDASAVHPTDASAVHPISESETYSTVDYLLGIHLIQPGEYYNEVLTHHTIFKDDHTLVFMLGKVRVYLCTRCTAMILGIIISLFLFHIIERVFGFYFPNEYYLYFNIIVPALALLDWGTQKLALRKATTKTRVITGLLIGFAMNNISKSPQLLGYHMIIVIVYFVIFFLFMIFGERRIIRY